MVTHVLPGNPPVEITLRRSAQARRLSLRVSGIDGRVTLTMPAHASTRAALAFASEKADWLRRHVAARAEDCVVQIGATVPVEGRMLRLLPGAGGRAPRIDGDDLLVPGSAETAPRRVQAWLRARARDRLAAASDGYAAKLGRGYSSLTLRDTRSRWGSCSASGSLMYSWRLILAPPEVLDYVAAHEVAHLAEMNHSPAFWAVVTRLYGNYATPRGWLQRHGAGLHRYRFD